MKTFDNQIGKLRKLYHVGNLPDGSHEIALGKHLWNIVPTDNGSFEIVYRGKHDYTEVIAFVEVVEHCHRDLYLIELIDDYGNILVQFGESIVDDSYFIFYMNIQ